MRNHKKPSLGGKNHIISIKYDRENQSWTLFDCNYGMWKFSTKIAFKYFLLIYGIVKERQSLPAYFLLDSNSDQYIRLPRTSERYSYITPLPIPGYFKQELDNMSYTMASFLKHDLLSLPDEKVLYLYSRLREMFLISAYAVGDRIILEDFLPNIEKLYQRLCSTPFFGDKPPNSPYRIFNGENSFATLRLQSI